MNSSRPLRQMIAMLALAALAPAAAQNYPAVARFLIDRGARVNVRNRAGKTPLAVAAGEDVAAVLKKAGA